MQSVLSMITGASDVWTPWQRVFEQRVMSSKLRTVRLAAEPARETTAIIACHLLVEEDEGYAGGAVVFALSRNHSFDRSTFPQDQAILHLTFDVLGDYCNPMCKIDEDKYPVPQVNQQLRGTLENRWDLATGVIREFLKDQQIAQTCLGSESLDWSWHPASLWRIFFSTPSRIRLKRVVDL